ncbi:hypothetical protein HIM_06138 [Hirsutella minnesotensis 3608]|uniref:Scytalone dehydratase-like domain-containing protein n=1 Tax=Hirsutella minnesotensis 3608 TaxID=1043627 RepID=A0A0F7ZZN7_9HYPO|nr:hypothetical protein HIM_06138 [Hirsutella minnesotensis 3608]
MATDIAMSDYLEIRNLAFEWAESYDNKDWDRLRRCLAPSICLDFRSLRGELHDNLNPDEYAAILSSSKLLGDQELKTQHLLGGAKWTQLSDGTVQVAHQLRVAHQRYTDKSLTTVANKGHGHGVVTHSYKKVDGAWKIAAVVPQLAWSEYDLFGTLNPEKH